MPDYRSGNLSRQFTDSERLVDNRVSQALAQPMVSGASGLSVGETYDWMKEDLGLRSALGATLDREQNMAYDQSARGELDRQAREQEADDVEARGSMQEFRKHLDSGLDYKGAYNALMKDKPNLVFNSRFKKLMDDGKDYFESDSAAQIRKAREANEMLRLGDEKMTLEARQQVMKENPHLADWIKGGIAANVESEYLQGQSNLSRSKFENRNIGKAEQIAELNQTDQLNRGQEAVDTFGASKTLRAKELQSKLQKIDYTLDSNASEVEKNKLVLGVGLEAARDAMANYPENRKIQNAAMKLQRLEGDEKLDSYGKGKEIRALLQDIAKSKAEHEYNMLPAQQELEKNLMVLGAGEAAEKIRLLDANTATMTEDQRSEILSTFAANGMPGVESPDGFMNAFPKETSMNIRSMIMNPHWQGTLNDLDKKTLEESLNTLNDVVAPGDVNGTKAQEKAKGFLRRKGGEYMMKNREAIDTAARLKAVSEISQNVEAATKAAGTEINKIENSAKETDTTQMKNDNLVSIISHAGTAMRKALNSNPLNDLAVEEFTAYLDKVGQPDAQGLSKTTAQSAAEARKLMASFNSKIQDNNSYMLKEKNVISEDKLKEAQHWVEEATKKAPKKDGGTPSTTTRTAPAAKPAAPTAPAKPPVSDAEMNEAKEWLKKNPTGQKADEIRKRLGIPQ